MASMMKLLQPLRSLLAYYVLFVESYAADERNAKNTGPSSFSRHCPFREPHNPMMGSREGTFANLVLCIWVGIQRDASHDCPLQEDSTFVWTERTMAKLGDSKEKRLCFTLQMAEFFFILLIGGDAVIYAVPFQQCLRLLGSKPS